LEQILFPGFYVKNVKLYNTGIQMLGFGVVPFGFTQGKICGLGFLIFDLELGTWDLEFGIWNLEFGSRDLEFLISKLFIPVSTSGLA